MLWPKKNGIYFYSEQKKKIPKWQKSLLFKSDITKSQYISSMFATVLNTEVSWAAYFLTYLFPLRKLAWNQCSSTPTRRIKNINILCPKFTDFSSS